MSPTTRLTRPGYTDEKTVSSITFFLYMLYIISFFLHLSARIPAIAVIRPDLLIALILIGLLFAQQDKLKGRFETPCNRYLLIFLGFTLISLPLVEWPGSVLRDNLAEFIKAFLFFHFTILIVDTDSRMKRLLLVFMLCQLFRVMEPLFLNLTTGYLGSRTYLGGGEFAGRLGGAPSDVINPNGLGLVIATLFPFLHYLWGNGRWFTRLAYLAVVPPLLYALVLTMSRSGFVALLVIVSNIFIKSRHKFVLLVVGTLIVAFAWTNMNDLQRDRYLSLTGAEDVQGAASAQGRVNGVIQEFEVGLKRPVAGFGLGTSQEAMFNVVGSRHLAHNLYTEALIETGFIGLFIFILFIKSIHDTLRQVALKLPAPSIREPKAGKGRKPKIRDSVNEGQDESYIYSRNLLMALNACFWMYIIFSLAQYGLREYHWFLLAGIATVLNRRIAPLNIDTVAAVETDESAKPAVSGFRKSGMLSQRTRSGRMV